MKKILYIITLTLALAPAFAFATTAVPAGQSEFNTSATAETPPSYVLLTPLPCVGVTSGSNGTTCTTANGTSDITQIGIQGYLLYLFKLLIGLTVFLAVVMTIFGGFKYMTQESVTGKSDARKTIENAVYGLLLALGSYLILYTINPNLVNLSKVNIPKLNISASATTQNSVSSLTSVSQQITANSQTQVNNAINANGQATANLQTDQNNENQIQSQIDDCDNGVTYCDPATYSNLTNQLSQAQESVTTDTEQKTTQTAVGNMQILVKKDVSATVSSLDDSQTDTTLSDVNGDLTSLQSSYLTASQGLSNDPTDQQTLSNQYKYSTALLTDEQALLSVKNGTMTADQANTIIQQQNNSMSNEKDPSLQSQYQTYATQVQTNVTQIDTAQQSDTGGFE